MFPQDSRLNTLINDLDGFKRIWKKISEDKESVQNETMFAHLEKILLFIMALIVILSFFYVHARHKFDYTTDPIDSP